MKKTKKICVGIVVGIIALLLGIMLLNYTIYATTNIPKVYITVEDAEAFKNMTLENGKSTASLQYTSPDLNFESNIKIGIQGSLSVLYTKKNYELELYKDSEYAEEQKVEMGQKWGELSQYTLRGNWLDKTHSRNIVTSRIAAAIQEKFGLFTNTPNNGVTDGFPVEVYLNNEFLGLYTWNLPRNGEIWNLDESDSNNIALEATYCSDATYFKKEITSIDTMELEGWKIKAGSPNQETVDKLNRVIRFVKDSTDEEFVRDFENYFDKDAVLNYLAVQYMTQGYDTVAKGMMLVTYNGVIWYPTLYSLDATYGTTYTGEITSSDEGVTPEYDWVPDAEGPYKTWAPHANDSLLLHKVLRCFPDDLADRWFELRKDIFTEEYISGEFNDFIEQIPEETYTQEAQTWGTLLGHDFSQIKEFLAYRLPFIDIVMYNKYTMEPELVLKYDISTPTQGDVTVVATPNRRDITITGENTYTFTDNGTYTFEGVDASGNPVVATANVDWIDRIAPELEVQYSETETTNEAVIVNIVANEPIQEVSGWKLSEDQKTLTKTYIANTAETIKVYDLAGNEKSVQVVVSNIEKVHSNVEVRYSETNPTNKDVIVNIIANKEIKPIVDWKISEDQKTLTRTYTTNTVEAIKVYDLADNLLKEVLISINNIDKEKPDVEINYSETELTNKDVTVTIVTNEEIIPISDWDVSEDKRTFTRTYTENTTESIKLYDLVGNLTEVTISVDNIDKTIFGVDVNYSKTELTNEDVVVSIVAERKIQPVTGWEISEDQKTLTKKYTSNTEEIVTVYDLEGKSREVKINVNNIDKVAPEVEVKYGETEITNEDVVVCIYSDEEIKPVSGWELSEDKKALTKMYESNATETIKIYDLADNVKEVHVSISNIDKTAPEIEVETVKEENGNVKVTITANEEIKPLQGWELLGDRKALTKIYTQEVQETIEVIDLAGNSTEVDINLIDLDTVAPEIKVDYSEKENTSGNVVVILTSNERIQAVDGWELSEDQMTLTKVYQNNASEKVEVKDLAGNIVNVEINVDNIDKSMPEIEVKYSTEKPTNQEVTVTITSNEELQEVEGWELSKDQKTLKKIYKNNNQEKVEIKDLAGNTASVKIIVDNIDKIKPEVEVKYSTKETTNQNVVVTITSNKEMQELSGWTISTDGKTLQKTYTKNVEEEVTIRDLAGNEIKVKVKVNNIDKEDKTTAGSVIPQAGENTMIIISILCVVTVGIVLYIKLKKFKQVK